MPESIVRLRLPGGRRLPIRVATSGGAPATLSLPYAQDFESTAVGAVPVGMARWDRLNQGVAAVAAWGSATSGTQGFATGGGRQTQLWATTPAQRDVEVSATVWPASSIDATPYTSGVIARASGLGSAAPTLYFAAAYASGGLQLQRWDAGAVTTLATVAASAYSPGVVSVTLNCNGASIKARLRFLTGNSAGKYLQPDGTAATTAAWAISATDGSPILSGGSVGLMKSNNYTTSDDWDDLTVLPATGDATPPTAAMTAPAAGATLTGTVTLSATASDDVGVARVVFSVDGVAVGTVLSGTGGSYSLPYNTIALANGGHQFSATAYDAAGNPGPATPVTATASNDIGVSRPTIAPARPYLRTCGIGYQPDNQWTPAGYAVAAVTDVGVTSNASIRAYNPNIHKLLYSNYGNIYYGALVSWLEYARANGHDPEGAFYHAASPRPYGGTGASTIPAKQWWLIFKGSGTTFANLLNNLYAANTLAFPAASGQALYIAYPERFREVNFASMTAAAAGGWAATLEYCSAIDGAGAPTAWSALSPTSDGTAGLTANGQLAFAPPAGWTPCVVAGAASLPAMGSTLGQRRFYYLRWRVTTGGTAPSYGDVSGRDFTGGGYANGPGTTPVFDRAADLDGDGFLSDAEYASRAAGKDARFYYESRLTTNYGPWRLVTSPAGDGFAAWAAADAAASVAGSDFNGVFVDNSTGTLPFSSGSIEPTSGYAAQYGSLLNAIWRALPAHSTMGPRWALPNIGAGLVGPTAEELTILPYCPAYWIEFYLNIFSDNWSTAAGRIAAVAAYQAATSPPPIGMVDSKTGGTTADDQDASNQHYALCYYYLMATPETYLTWWGGEQTTLGWEYKAPGSAGFDVGAATAAYATLESGPDPANASLTYKVYRRDYANAMVLYKPLSVGGARGAASATTHDLSAIHAAGYKPVNPDGTLGTTSTSVSLQNGQGAIMVPQ